MALRTKLKEHAIQTSLSLISKKKKFIFLIIFNIMTFLNLH